MKKTIIALSIFSTALCFSGLVQAAANPTVSETLCSQWTQMQTIQSQCGYLKGADKTNCYKESKPFNEFLSKQLRNKKIHCPS